MCSAASVSVSSLQHRGRHPLFVTASLPGNEDGFTDEAQSVFLPVIFELSPAFRVAKYRNHKHTEQSDIRGQSVLKPTALTNTALEEFKIMTIVYQQVTKNTNMNDENGPSSFGLIAPDAPSLCVCLHYYSGLVNKGLTRPPASPRPGLEHPPGMCAVFRRHVKPLDVITTRL